MRATTIGSNNLQAAKQEVEHAAHEAKPWVERLARFGYCSKGVVYIVVGWLALLAAFSLGGKKTGAEGALTTIAQQPFGKWLLAVVAFGLVGYALWRIVQGIADPEHKGTDAKGLAKRTGYVINGLAYSSLALTAFGILRGVARGKDSSPQDATASLLAQPFGQWLVGLVGLILIAVGANSVYIAVKEKFRDKLKLSEMSPAEQTWATRLGKIGLIARAIVSALVGSFLIQAAFQSDPNKARGLDGTLKVVAQQPYGQWLLAVVAVGLMAYGVYSFVEARYRRVMGS